MASNNLLDVVNENDIVIGRETREIIHREGLLHRGVIVWFVTPAREIIFQHRAKDKDIYPDLLSSTAGGGVDAGMTYEDAALAEIEEETGIKAKKEDLCFMVKLRRNSMDRSTGAVDNAFHAVYAYKYKGTLSNLRIEKGKAIGFEAWPIDTLLNLSEPEKKRFIPLVLRPEYRDLFRKIEEIAK